MKNQDWERFGEDIKRSVQDAVDSGDFSRLNQTITNTVNGAADAFSDTMRNMGARMGQNRRPRYGEPFYGEPQYGQSGYKYNGPEDGDPPYGEAFYGEPGQQTNAQSRTNRSDRTYSDTKNAVVPSVQSLLYKSTGTSKVGAIVMCVCGYMLSAFNVLVFLSAVVVLLVGVSGATEVGVGVMAIVFAILSAVTIVVAVMGTKKLGGIKRFRQYLQVLNGKEYCDIRKLAEQIGKNEKFVLKDIKNMIRRGWFRQGHLDAQEKCLIASHEAYHQYTDMMEHKEEQQKENEIKQKAAEEEQRKREAKGLTPEVQEVVDAGEAYIRKIHECNDAIPGAEISAKISRMEMLVDKIFDRVEENPESVGDLHRLMNYYLPTTVKLLEAYEELDKQPIQGENIISSKEEIEKTLDTLNVAFEKLLDALFQDTAWDVASDISVLKTMLAQEGLTEDGLKKS